MKGGYSQSNYLSRMATDPEFAARTREQNARNKRAKYQRDRATPEAEAKAKARKCQERRNERAKERAARAAHPAFDAAVAACVRQARKLSKARKKQRAGQAVEGIPEMSARLTELRAYAATVNPERAERERCREAVRQRAIELVAARKANPSRSARRKAAPAAPRVNPVFSNALFMSVWRITPQHRQDREDIATEAIIALLTGTAAAPADAVRLAIKAVNKSRERYGTLSLDAPVWADGATTRLDLLADPATI